MGFIADKQTLDDLNITGKYKNNSVYTLFNQVRTAGGEKLLVTMFQQPLTDASAINARSRIFQYFESKAFGFPFTNEQVNATENWLNGAAGGGMLASGANTLRVKLMSSIGAGQEYDLLKKGLQATMALLGVFNGFLLAFPEHDANNPYQAELLTIKHIFQDKRLKELLEQGKPDKLSLPAMMKCDHLLRQSLREEMQTVLQAIYQLDVYIAVGAVSRAKGFSYALALPKGDNIIRLEGFYHPALEKAVANRLSMHPGSNVLFLTGANMAGKSTFMKSFGIAIYLAHMGFPVAAKQMEFSVKDGIYSSINVPDNLHMGYSHFYAEVLRVKKVAEAVSESKDLVIIFDELFKGTNVKDAYDATLAVSEAFGENRNCAFIISTHIIEVGEELRKQCSNFQFAYLPTVMKGVTPTYTYLLEDGITSDRHGMMIIENEGILDIILCKSL